MKIKTLVAIKHNGANLPIGSELEAHSEDKDEIKILDRLVRLKAAEVVESDNFKDSEKPQDNTSKGSPDLSGTHLNQAIIALCELDSVDDELAQKLIDAGFVTVDQVADADSAELIEVKGIGKKTCIKIQQSAIVIIAKKALQEVECIDGDMLDALLDASITTVKELYEAESDDLTAIDGIEEADIEKIQASAEKIIERDDPEYFDD